MWGKKKDVIGLDIGCSSIKLVELKEDKNGYKLQNLAISPLPPEAIVDGALMDSVTIIDTIRDADRRFQDKGERCRDLCLWPFCHCQKNFLALYDRSRAGRIDPVGS